MEAWNLICLTSKLGCQIPTSLLEALLKEVSVDDVDVGIFHPHFGNSIFHPEHDISFKQIEDLELSIREKFLAKHDFLVWK